MKILVISDTHGWERELESFLQPLRGQVDLILHAGDSELQTDSSELKEVVTVAGNCDVFSSFPAEKLLEASGLVIQLTHGHYEGVKSSLTELAQKAQENKATIALYGHTHIPKVQRFGEVITINPGSLRLPKGKYAGSYCVLDITDEAIQINYFTMDGTAIEALEATFNRNDVS